MEAEDCFSPLFDDRERLESLFKLQAFSFARSGSSTLGDGKCSLLATERASTQHAATPRSSRISLPPIRHMDDSARDIHLSPIHDVLDQALFEQPRDSDISKSEAQPIKKVDKAQRRRDRVPHLKRDSKVSLDQKKKNFERYSTKMRLKGFTQILMRIPIVNELRVESSLWHRPILVLQGWQEMLEALSKACAISARQEHYHLLTRMKCRRASKDYKITLSFQYDLEDETPERDVFYFNVLSITSSEKNWEWFHYMKGSTFILLGLYLLGGEFDYSINDNQVEPIIGNDLKVISARKRCISRLRSYAKDSLLMDPFPEIGSTIEVRNVEPKLRKQLKSHIYISL